MVLIVHAGIVRIDISPFRGREGAWMIGLACLDQTAVAHCFAVGGFWRTILVKLCFIFPPYAVCCAADRSKHTVSGTVDKCACMHTVKRIGIQLPSGN